MATATQEKQEAKTKEPTREERAKDALKRAGLSTDLKGYDRAQIDRAAEAAPQRRGKALGEFIMTGPKAASAPREVRLIEWDLDFKKEHAGEYALFVSAKGKDSFKMLGFFEGNGMDAEKAIAKKVGVSYPDGLREFVGKHDIWTVTARFCDRVAGVKQPKEAA